MNISKLDARRFSYLSVIILLLFSFVYAIYTIPEQVALGGEWYPNPNATNPHVPSSFSEIASRLYASIISYLLIAIIAGYLAFKTYKAASYLSGIRRETLLYLATYFILVSIGSLLLAIGITTFVLEGNSETKILLFTGELYFYPLTIPISSAIISVSVLYIPMFGYLLSEKKRPTALTEGVLFALIVLELILLALPQNWYGCYVPYRNNEPLYPDYRPLSVLMMLVIFLFGTLVTVAKVYKRIKVTDDPVVKVRLKILSVALILFDLFFIFYVIDSIIGGGFTIFMVLATISAVLAFIGVYLAIVPPEWLISRLQRKYGFNR